MGNLLPVAIGHLDITGHVLQPGIPNVLVEVQIELAADDLPPPRIAVELGAHRHAEGTVAAKLGKLHNGKTCYPCEWAKLLPMSPAAQGSGLVRFHESGPVKWTTKMGGTAFIQNAAPPESIPTLHDLPGQIFRFI